MSLQRSTYGDSLPDGPAEQQRAGLELFERHVRPGMITHCFRCHGGDAVQADVDLSTRESLLASGHVQDRSEDSHLMAVLRHEAEPHMPHKGAKLPAELLESISQWIDLGAPYSGRLGEKTSATRTTGQPITDEDREFWSFRPLAVSQDRLALPPGEPHPIDRFVRARQEELSLRSNPPADRRTLLRRATFDLLGLPPTIDELHAFLADRRPDAYERLIDRLLASPHYGERWARHWLDIARFGESSGFEHDDDRPHAYHYRDFLVQAFNQDMPYDKFVAWQLAGDELAPDNSLAAMATGFLGAGVFPTQLTEVEFEKSRYDELDDMLSTTGVAFLGLSLGCARCHDHKYDPIPSRDYYRLLSHFATTVRCEVDLVPRPGAAQAKILICSEGLTPVRTHADDRGYPHFYEQVYFLKRGDVQQRQEPVTPGYLQVLMRSPALESKPRQVPPAGWTRTRFHRANLAQWITDPHDGAGQLAARVMVNRLWHHHFGRGIVTTPNDFGRQGARPTHPELLDWLANELIRSHWQLKPIHRWIMTSQAYQQSSSLDREMVAIDPANAYLWRYPVRRLEGEAIRDAMLVISGQLDRTMYGPGSLDESMRRRSIYFTVKRSRLIPSMMLFDWPEHLVSIGSRETTTTAPQALLFLNSPHGRQYAERFAQALTRIANSDPSLPAPVDDPSSPDGANSQRSLIENGFLIVFGRPPSPHEYRDTTLFLTDQQRLHHHDGAPDPSMRALVDFCQTLLGANDAVYVH